MSVKRYDPKNWRQVSQRQRMSPFPNYMSMESVCKEMRDFVGVSIKNFLLIFEGNVFAGFQGMVDYQHKGRAIADLVHKNPKLYSYLSQQENRYGKKLVNFAKRANRAVKPGLTDRALYQLFVNYEKYYKLVYASYGSVWTMEEFLFSDLLAIVQKRLPDAVKAVDVLNALTKQPSAMVASIERMALLRLALAVSGNTKWAELLKVGDVVAIKVEPNLEKLISQHVKQYFWLTRDYEDPVLTFEKIIERLDVMLKTDVKTELQTMSNELRNTEIERKRWIKELKLNKKEIALFAAMRDAAHLKELRKRFVSESLYYFDKVLEEIGRRTYLSIKQVRFMRTKDVKEALLAGKDFTEELNARLRLSVWIAGDKGTRVITGEAAKQLQQAFCQADKNAKEFIGMPVSPGVARGPARIIMNPDECDKVKKGDIIVTVQVVPSFSTAIIKSAGIVCDGGHGVTSHPATLAREAKIPCVIQTRFAREVLKDGDMIEVDGYKGVVKKLNN
ncbi:MAG: hypothetical protein HY980_03835 [Candidatus Magasanikbacteria bacterium]|nr:hypothetical protein [Candidatus Magasanikbacteria bacterium]